MELGLLCSPFETCPFSSWARVIDEDGEIRSFFFVTVDLDWLDDQVDGIAVPKEATLLVMDGLGAELARNPRSPTGPPGCRHHPWKEPWSEREILTAK